MNNLSLFPCICMYSIRLMRIRCQQKYNNVYKISVTVFWSFSPFWGCLGGPTLSFLITMNSGVLQKELLSGNQRHSDHPGHSQGFRSSVPGSQNKDQIYFYYASVRNPYTSSSGMGIFCMTQYNNDLWTLLYFCLWNYIIFRVHVGLIYLRSLPHQQPPYLHRAPGIASM